MRIAPSRRMTSPLSISFSRMCRTSAPILGPTQTRRKRDLLRSDCRAGSGSPANTAVEDPGAIAITRMPWRANSGASGKVMLTMPPLTPHRPPGRSGRRRRRPSGVDDDAAFAGGVRRFCIITALARRSTLKVPIRLIWIVLTKRQADSGPLCRGHFSARATPGNEGPCKLPKVCSARGRRPARWPHR